MKSYIWEQTASTVEIMLDWPNIEGSVVKAGTPISQDGKVANDETAVGILVYDAVFVNSPMPVNKPSVVLIEGIVDLEGVEADCGLTISDEAKTAMKDITFTPVVIPEPGPAFEVMEGQADSTASTVAALKTDFNALLAKLIAGGFMAEPEPEPEADPEPDTE